MGKKNNDLKDLRAENPEVFDRLMQEHDAAERYSVYSKVDEQAAWDKFRKARFEDKSTRHAAIINIWHYVAAAAVVLLVVSVGIAFLFRNSDGGTARRQSVAKMEQQERVGQKVTGTPAPSAATATSSYYASSQGTATSPLPMSFFDNEDDDALLSSTSANGVLHLDDGTTVWLNSGATLKYPAHFAAGNRTVYLEGEAYFEVHAEAGRPFYVRTASGTVKEYGTQFNVKASASATTVTLVEGRISVLTDGGSERNIEPGQQAVMHAGSSVAVVSDIDVTNTIAWKTGIYSLDNVSLGELAEKLEAWYGCKVVFESNEVRNVTFSGILNRNRRLSTILSAISFATGVKIRGTDSTVIFE